LRHPVDGLLGALAAAWRARARSRVDMAAPAGIHIVELQVAPEHRNQVWRTAARRGRTTRARAAGATLSLTTALNNPARHLYERFGFTVEGEKRDARYEAITGSPGRVLR